MNRRIRASKVGLFLLFSLLASTTSRLSRAASLVHPNVVPDSTQDGGNGEDGPNEETETALEESIATTTTPQEQTVAETDNTVQTTTTMKTADNSGSGTATGAVNKCRWGEHCPEVAHNSTVNNGGGGSATTVPPSFLSTSKTKSKSPPEGFVLSGRVYTSPQDKLAHFDFTDKIVLEYWECGVMGSTTSPLVVKNAYFRHALVGREPNLWSGTEYGTHPQLLIPLKGPLTLILNSGEHHVFQAGQVILLEDTVKGGHKIRSDAGDLSALLLTLPQTHHKVGKDVSSLTSSKKWACATSNDQQVVWNVRNRTLIFGGIGLGLSSALSWFLAKVAPLWLSVGVGGMCLITGATLGAVQCGEYLYQEIELALEKHKLDDALDATLADDQPVDETQ